jgi:hypothetical protein
VYKDRIMAIVVITIAVFVFAMSSRLPRGTMEQDPGPAVFPEVVAIAMAGLALALFFTAGSKKKQEKPREISQALDEVQDISEPAREKIKRILACVALLAAFTVCLPVLGFIATTVIFGIGFLMLLYRVQFKKCLVPAIVISIFSYILFEIGFGIPLPRFLQLFR